MLTVNELFSGIGAFRKALVRLGIPHQIVGISEIDKYAIMSYEAIYGKTFNYGDISKVEHLKYADLWTYGFPCQDVSICGRNAGIVKGQTRSGLLYEVQRLLEDAKNNGILPKYLILENVRNLVGKKYKAQFLDWLGWLESLGYNSYWKVINASDCGIPQNRERVFAVSIRKDIDHGFTFPPVVPLRTDFIDLLEDNVEDKYYLSDAYIEYARNASMEMVKVGNGFKFKPIERERERESNSQNRDVESRVEDDRQLYCRAYLLNPAHDGTCRTIKAQYGRTSYANLIRGDTLGASGVVKYEM